MVKALHAIREFLEARETFVIVRACLTSFWFWLPVLWGGYVCLQIWLIVEVSPLAILILPGAISAYLVVTREKRLKAQYGIEDEKPKSLNPYSLVTASKPQSSWDIEKAVEDYKKNMMEGKEEDKS